jgi:hypothetical protein
MQTARIRVNNRELSFVCLFVYHPSPYSTILQLHDGGQFLLVEERTRNIMQCIWEETTDLPQAN